MTKKIIFSSGGTGGHIFPAINLMKYFSNKGYDVLLVTDIRGNIFLKNHSQFRSYIISADTPSNKSFLPSLIFLSKTSTKFPSSQWIAFNPFPLKK